MIEAREFGRNELENIMETLLVRTQKQKQGWRFLEYRPISINEENVEGLKTYSISQKIKMETVLYRQILLLEIAEKIHLPSEKGDISGTLSYNGKYGIQIYEFALSYDWEKYNLCEKNNICSEFSNSIIVKLDYILMEQFIKTSAITYKISDLYFSQKNEFKALPIVTLCEKMMQERRVLEFHNCVLDIDYRTSLYEIL